MRRWDELVDFSNDYESRACSIHVCGTPVRELIRMPPVADADDSCEKWATQRTDRLTTESEGPQRNGPR